MSEESEKQFYLRVRGRVSGPHTLAALVKILNRGGIARVDELSENQIDWQRAAEFQALFPKRVTPQVTAKVGPAPATESNEATRPASPSPPSAGPLYNYAQNGVMVGPVTVDALRSLATSGELKPIDPVWTAGSNVFVEARELDFLASVFSPKVGMTGDERTRKPSSPLRRSMIAATVGIIVALLAGGAYLAYLKSRPAPTNPLIIQDVKNQAQIDQAVGLVVCGSRSIKEDGTVTEYPGFPVIAADGLHLAGSAGSTGSCFAISPTGYLITNRHVVLKVQTFQNRRQLKDQLYKNYSVDWTPKVWVFFSGRKYDAELVYVSTRFDMAILHVQRSDSLFFRVSSTTNTPRGTEVYAVGFPGIANESISDEQEKLADDRASTFHTDVAQDFTRKQFMANMNGGTLSRIVQEEADGVYWIDHDTQIEHGNSGGALLRGDGLVLGITQGYLAKASKDDKGNVVDFARQNHSLEISQLKDEIEAHVKDASWE